MTVCTPIAGTTSVQTSTKPLVVTVNYPLVNAETPLAGVSLNEYKTLPQAFAIPEELLTASVAVNYC